MQAGAARVRGWIGVSCVLVVGELLHAAGLWRGPVGHAVFEVALYAAVPFAAALSALARAAAAEPQRRAWALLGAGLALWGCGNALWLFVFRTAAGTPDSIFFLAFYPCAFAGLVALLRARSPEMPGALWMDGVSGALTVAALGVGLVLPRILAHGDATGVAAVTSLAYPVLDLALCAFVVFMLTVARWQPGRDWIALGAGLLALLIGDSLWTLDVGTGAEWTDPVSVALWCAALTSLAWAPWLRARPLPPPSTVTLSVLLWPFGLFALALGMVIAGNYVALAPAALWLAVAAMVVSLGRSATTFFELRSLPETLRQARTDELTGLTNRRGFFEALDRQVGRRPDRLAAVLMLDLDRFKELNDTMGHQTGDRLLEQLGPRLTAGLRPADTLARLGGDEFAVLCPGAGPDGARRVAERLQEALRQPFSLGDLQVHVDASVGIAIYPQDGATPDELLQRADVAMYQAKAGRTDFERYDASRDGHSRDRLTLVGELRRGLERGGELELHYQPQVSLSTDRVIAVEALVRWRHPRRGLLGPDAFLDAADGAGLMRRVGREVLRQAVDQAAAWIRAGEGVPVAVNLSTADLVDPRVAEEVAAVLDEHGVEGSWLKLEITETTVMAQPDRVVETLRELRALGCRVALDDFGTGHASLAHVLALPVDELKIDRSFVLALDGPGDGSGPMAIVRSVSLLGTELGLSVVAEGVETPKAWAQLVGAGCTAAQGYLLSRPLPPDELERWLAARRLLAQAV